MTLLVSSRRKGINKFVHFVFVNTSNDLESRNVLV